MPREAEEVIKTLMRLHEILCQPRVSRDTDVVAMKLNEFRELLCLATDSQLRDRRGGMRLKRLRELLCRPLSTAGLLRDRCGSFGANLPFNFSYANRESAARPTYSFGANVRLKIAR